MLVYQRVCSLTNQWRCRFLALRKLRLGSPPIRWQAWEKPRRTEPTSQGKCCSQCRSQHGGSLGDFFGKLGKVMGYFLLPWIKNNQENPGPGVASDPFHQDCEISSSTRNSVQHCGSTCFKGRNHKGKPGFKWLISTKISHDIPIRLSLLSHNIPKIIWDWLDHLISHQIVSIDHPMDYIPIKSYKTIITYPFRSTKNPTTCLNLGFFEVSLGSPCGCGAAAQLATGLERGEPGASCERNADGEIHVFFFLKKIWVW